MQLEDLRLIILNERESGKLSKIHPDTFEKAQEYLSSLYREAHNETRSLDNFLSEQAHGVLEEINSAKETLKDIVRLRMRKILLLAMLQAENRHVDRDEIKKMQPAEKEMFDEIACALDRCRQLFLDEVTSEDSSFLVENDTVLPPVEEPYDAYKEGADVRHQEHTMALVRILQDTDAFMGVDGRIYHLGREDVVTLPRQNAVVLCDRNIALNIRLSK